MISMQKTTINNIIQCNTGHEQISKTIDRSLEAAQPSAAMHGKKHASISWSNCTVLLCMREHAVNTRHIHMRAVLSIRE